MIAFILKSLALIIVLATGVVAISYGLTYVKDVSEREMLATLSGGAATIFAGWLAWQSVTMQARRADIERSLRVIARKVDAVVAITQPVHAAATWLASLSKELLQPGDRDGKSLRAKRLGRQLDQVLDRELILALLPDLGADDRIDLLMIIATMRTALAMTQIHSVEEVLSGDDFMRTKDVLAKLDNHVARFDSDLHKAFQRDSGLTISKASSSILP